MQANLGKNKTTGFETAMKWDDYLVVFQSQINTGKIYVDLWTNIKTNNTLNEQKSLQRKFLLF